MLIVEFSSQGDRAIGGLFHLLFLLLMMFPHFILDCRQAALNNKIVRQRPDKRTPTKGPSYFHGVCVGFWDVFGSTKGGQSFPECSEILVYLQMLGRPPRLLNYSLAYFTLGLRGRRSKGREFRLETALEGEAPRASCAPEIPLPFPSRRTPVTQATFHLRPFSTDAVLATHVNER